MIFISRIKKRAVATALCLALALPLSAKQQTSVAVVVDGGVYPETRDAVDAYCNAIRQYDGRRTILLVMPEDVTPDAIRDTLKHFYHKGGLEGAVLIGDIPVPMIRRAHHLSTAFKMDPRYDRFRSSIPSDRFYDDFGLSFDFIDSDGKYFYYNLSPDGEQKVSCDIYSARIKPRRNDPEHSFCELISEYLLRAAEAKSTPETLDKAFHYAGHGNSSESINARIDEDRAMYEQFGFTGTDERVSFINFDEDRVVKARFMSILSDPTLDYAHIHSHGAWYAQYLSKEPYTNVTAGHMDAVKAVLRAKMRRAADKEKAAQSIADMYAVPLSWLDGWDDPEITAADSLKSASTEISLEDLDAYRSGAKVLILDACFNGSFHRDDYIAARYAFGHGSSTMAVLANSVNIIQDHWKNEFAGLLVCGTSVGNWAKETMTLESHIIGDPTWHFASSKSLKELPDAKCLDIRNGKYSTAKVKSLLKGDASVNVRMEAFMHLIRNSSDMEDVVWAIRTGLDDPYEMIRRMAARYAEICGDPELLEPVARHYLDPLESSRVRFHLFSALGLYDFEDVKNALDGAKRGYWPEDAAYTALISRLETICKENEAEFAAIPHSDVSVKERKSTIKGQRNACSPAAIDPMLELLRDESADSSLRCTAAEALGWYVVSYRRDYILEQCKSIRTEDEVLADELRMTVRRLEDNANL